MSITLSNTAIITPTDVADSAFKGFEVDLESLNDPLLAVCDAVSEIVDTELNRRFHVHAATVYPKGWKKARNTTYAFEHWMEDWPVVEVDETIVTTPARPGGQLIFSDEKHESITGYFGYMRHDQTLAKINTLLSSTISATPETLPHAVREVANSIAHYIVHERMTAQYSGQRVTNLIATGGAQITEGDRMMINRLLKRIQPYRKRA